MSTFPMPQERFAERHRFRAAAFAAAAILIVGHISLLLFRFGTQTASLWGDWFGAAAALLATGASWSASSTAGLFARRVWRLIALSCLLAFIGEVLYTYYYDYQQAPGIWPSDVLVFFWAVPAMMALFLSPRDQGSGYRWLRTFDFVQVCTLILSLELATIYVPSRWQTAERTMENRTAEAGLIFFSLLALGFLVRGLLAPSPTVRKLFRRLAIFFVAFAITTSITLYAQTSDHYEQGRWPDLLWTVTYCGLAILATTWHEGEPDPPVSTPAFGRMQMLGLFSPLLIPVIVFPLALHIAREQLWWSVVLVMVSLASASGRMFVVQNQLLVNSRELQRNLSLLQGITEGTTDAIFVKDLQGRYLMINSAGARFLGRDLAEILGRSDVEMFSPGSGRQIMERDRIVIESGTSQTYEEVGIAGGVARTYLATKGPFRDTNGKVVGLLGICRDITERKRAEEDIRKSQHDLRLSEERFYKAFDSNPEGITITTVTDGRFIEVNDAYLQVMGYDRSEMLGKTVAELNIWCQPQDRAKMIQEVALKGHVRNIQTTFRTKAGQFREVEISAESIQLEEEQCLLTITRDVTQNKMLEQQLRQAQKMEAVGRLAGGVAHDFNNLVGVILGCTELLTEEAVTYPGLTKRTETIKSACRRAASLTAQLLAFSRQQMLQPEVLNLNAMVSETAKMLLPLLREDIDQRIVLDPALGAIKADPGQILQVIMNLAVNAGDAMPNGGQLTIETGNVVEGESTTQQRLAVRPGAYVMLRVTDSGVGMDEEALTHIFEPFYTTKKGGQGTGLGLATVSGIVEQSGGYIVVESELGKGTTFRVHLPRVDERPQSHADETLPETARGSETVLLVEDDNLLRELIHEGLREAGYKVLVAANGVDALRTSEQNPTRIDVLVTDVIMPQMNGPDLARSLALRRPGMKVLFISGYTEDKLRCGQLVDPDVALIQKPFQLIDLTHKLRQILDRPDFTRPEDRGRT